MGCIAPPLHPALTWLVTPHTPVRYVAWAQRSADAGEKCTRSSLRWSRLATSPFAKPSAHCRIEYKLHAASARPASALSSGKGKQYGNCGWHFLGALRRECVRPSALRSARVRLTDGAALQARRRCSRSCSVWSPPWASWTSAWRVRAACVASSTPHHALGAGLTHHATQTCGRRRAPSLSTAWSCPPCLAASS